LAERFEPIVSESLDSVGATDALDNVMDRTRRLPFVSTPDLDLDAYVTEKAMDGLFFMIAREEENIRKDPLARTTDLLKKVFGLAGADEEGGKKKTPWWKKMFRKDG
jgi:hypothetical protein